MIAVPVRDDQIEEAKRQIAEFLKTPEGGWRYLGADGEGVKAWRGIVCQSVVCEWLGKNGFRIIKATKGVDTSGKTDAYDILTDRGTFEVCGATEYYYRRIMPKKQPIDTKSDDMILIGAKYDDRGAPDKVEIHGFMKFKAVKNYPVGQLYGGPFYDVPIEKLEPIESLLATTENPS